jgi:PEGA domain
MQRPRQRPAELRTLVEPNTARVQIDEQFAGAARVLAMRPASVKPGKHRITVEAPGYFPHDAEVELAPGVTTVNLKLRPVPP